MKTFLNLIEEVQDTGLCHRCGGCVTFCTSINYGALELSPEGKPQFSDSKKCIECGLCYSICPEIGELEEETKQHVSWTEPIGHTLEMAFARALDKNVRSRATDGGVVTALLLHLFDSGRIDGAIVTKQSGPYSRDPFLAVTREEIINAAGFFFDTSHGVAHISDSYSTCTYSIQEVRPMMQKGLRRVAFVGTPCQIKALRKIETLGIVPSDVIKFSLGLFCSGNFVFGTAEREKVAALGQFKWEEVKKLNIKDQLMIQLHDGNIKTIALDELEFMKRYACRFCPDYSAEYADISFGGIGAEEGWTSVIARSPLGRAVLTDALGKTIERYDTGDDSTAESQISAKVKQASEKKKKKAQINRDKIHQVDKK
jgi:coenzyme F420 hydrogenase subunit beta